jgi:hypothetical protein
MVHQRSSTITYISSAADACDALKHKARVPSRVHRVVCWHCSAAVAIAECMLCCCGTAAVSTRSSCCSVAAVSGILA